MTGYTSKMYEWKQSRAVSEILMSTI